MGGAWCYLPQGPERSREGACRGRGLGGVAWPDKDVELLD